MKEKNDHPATEANASQLDWRALPFDAVTNFSLLGWMLDRFRIGKKSEEKVDLKLDE